MIQLNIETTIFNFLKRFAFFLCYMIKIKNKMILRTPSLAAIFLLISFVNENDWTKSLDKDDIVIYTRSVESSPFHEFLAETEMTGTIDKFREIITDFERYPEWLPDCKSAVIIENPDSNDFTYHMKIKVPFPFSNRDIIQQIVLSESGNTLLVEIISQPKKMKKNKDFVRMETADGRWIIDKITEGKISIKFQYLADPGGGVPTWLVNTFIVKNPHKTLQNLREMMQEG
jgi:ribosome-associated toxin RatA of RatAB toxin-antitoxin module